MNTQHIATAIPSTQKQNNFKPGDFKPGELRLGILGGGQLARMLALAAHPYGIEVHILSPSSSDPAAQVVRHHQRGNPDIEADLKQFLQHVDIATFESEFLNAELLQKVGKEVGTTILPDPAVMGELQDRWTQKQNLKKYKLPTANFCSVSSLEEARWAFREWASKQCIVLKKRRFGYDGYGTFIIRNEQDLESPQLMKEWQAMSASTASSPGFIAESYMPFQRELAFMIARSRSGEVIHLPVVESFQENSRCLWVKGPLTLSPEKYGQTEIAEFWNSMHAFLDGIQYEGIMGVELFELVSSDGKKSLSINEIAPRVHNSGHYSQNALFESQFNLHIKAILDLPLGKAQLLAPGFAMYNLLGRLPPPLLNLPQDIALHWYDKRELRAGRKMGHLNTLGNSPDEALQKLLSAINSNSNINAKG